MMEQCRIAYRIESSTGDGTDTHEKGIPKGNLAERVCRAPEYEAADQRNRNEIGIVKRDKVQWWEHSKNAPAKRPKRSAG